MGLAYDGQFQISGWKCINNPNSSFKLPGTAVIFGYSFDILAGTDWPYSGCFWGWDKQDIPVNGINIYIDGLCRLAGIIFISTQTKTCTTMNSTVIRTANGDPAYRKERETEEG